MSRIVTLSATLLIMALLSPAPAPADPLRIYTRIATEDPGDASFQCGTDAAVEVCLVYLEFDDIEDRLAGIEVAHIVTPAPGGFYQVPADRGGSDTAPFQFFTSIFPELACDSFVTVGYRAAPISGDCTTPDASFASDMFNAAGLLIGGWFCDMSRADQNTAGEDRRVLIAQLGYEAGFAASGVGTAYFDDGAEPFEFTFTCGENEAPDLDGDGVTAGQGDCDDGDPDSYPGADELCDRRDNDCDGVVPADEVDEDGDGVTVCEGDCDDEDPANAPDQTEVCDGQDNDCNDLDDFGQPGAGGREGDTDGDTVLDCADECPEDPAKVRPGACGCHVPDADSDGDGAFDCQDQCHLDPEKTVPGFCGCGQVEQTFTVSGIVFGDVDAPLATGMPDVTVALDCTPGGFHHTRTSCPWENDLGGGLFEFSEVPCGVCTLSMAFDGPECAERFELPSGQQLPVQFVLDGAQQGPADFRVVAYNGRFDANGDGRINLTGDLPAAMDCLIGGQCDQAVGPEPGGACRVDCNLDGLATIIGDLGCLMDCYFLGACGSSCGRGARAGLSTGFAGERRAEQRAEPTIAGDHEGSNG